MGKYNDGAGDQQLIFPSEEHIRAVTDADLTKALLDKDRRDALKDRRDALSEMVRAGLDVGVYDKIDDQEEREEREDKGK